MATLFCSGNVESNLTVNVQLEDVANVLNGDCQYVLFNVTVSPSRANPSSQVFTASFNTTEKQSRVILVANNETKVIYNLLMQQTRPLVHKPLARPPIVVHVALSKQLPISLDSDLQLSPISSCRIALSIITPSNGWLAGLGWLTGKSDGFDGKPDGFEGRLDGLEGKKGLSREPNCRNRLEWPSKSPLMSGWSTSPIGTSVFNV